VVYQRFQAWRHGRFTFCISDVGKMMIACRVFVDHQLHRCFDSESTDHTRVVHTELCEDVPHMKAPKFCPCRYNGWP